ncbi:glyoxalase [Streptomyces sp. SID8111]|uniref:glyoxalase n=1 Tax=Streptomyces sp. SID8111 TaxID=2706100 RepID=UPI0013C1182B|nr:glyoxalase [Streptomyces sp. SID8111]NEC29655.1 glyoxalase [Streptomyces sp. SID8111]
MNSLTHVTLEVDDSEAARRFYTAAFGLGPQVRLRASTEPTSGFRGFTLSLDVPRPADVDSFTETALQAGATQLKPPAKSLWGYGGIVQAPDGTIWQIVTSNKKNTGPATRTIDNVVLLLGVQDVKASKQFYTEQGLKAAKSFGGKYAEFAPQDTDAVSLALYKRRGLAKLAGVSEEGTGSHRITLHGHAGDFTDPDAFRWDSAVTTTSA